MQQDLKLCRICAKSHSNISSHTLFERSRKSVLRKISQLTGIMLKNVKNLPQQMCIDCESELDRAYDFRERCNAAQAYFTSPEYKRKLNEENKRKSNKVNSSSQKPWSELKCDIFSYKNAHEADCAEIVKETEMYLTNVLDVTTETEKELTTLNEAEILQVLYDDENVSLRERTSENISYEITHGNLIHERDESDGTEIKITDVVLKTHTWESDATTKKSKRERKMNGKRTYICDQCGNHFSSRNYFYAHIQRHSGIKPIQCEVCPKKFFTEGELKRHMRRHTGERPFACQHCQRRFTDSSTRVKHERTHTNDRPFGCGLCGKAFTTSYILKNHMLVHTGERTFKCTLCNKSFQRQTNLMEHNRSLTHKYNLERNQQKLLQEMSEETNNSSPLTPMDM